MQINLKLDKTKLQYIVEALLFAASCDVCASWYHDNCLDLFKIAKSIKDEYPDLILKNVFIHDPRLSEPLQSVDEFTPDIIQNFPEILKETII
jgi:hypothetical protein